MIFFISTETDDVYDKFTELVNWAQKKEIRQVGIDKFIDANKADIYFVVWQNDKGYKEIFILNYEEDDEEELHWVDDDCEVQDEYVIAWKEIVLPKEIKND